MDLQRMNDQALHTLALAPNGTIVTLRAPKVLGSLVLEQDRFIVELAVAKETEGPLNHLGGSARRLLAPHRSVTHQLRMAGVGPPR